MDHKQLFRSMMDAIRSGDCEQMKTILRSHPAAATMTTPFGSWLHVAASKGQLEMVKVLVKDFDLDVDLGNSVSNGAPIHSAALGGNYDVVKYLLDRGAKLDTSEPVRNPLFGAILGGNVEVAKLLLESGIDKSVRYSGEVMDNTDALAFARERGATEFVAILSD